ncbi:hypothetical protein HYH02_012988 [Chlamydomonas schloesseri]|uniref:Uncharacterized protein n=1 Tax=Chlamydomonas schloesseri TaxID=2026947 RepID=A0A835VWZ5_9CHLO|nr:hypothetical protein HYH02_012988 [Chlamydomonas schloesseri]|eukprot:KAG2432417.1 hypothetical protein HYH02_012988 [Chlamydomonas schloesseri]
MAELEALLAASQARQAAERAALQARQAAAEARPETPPDAFVSTHFVSVQPITIHDSDSEDDEPAQVRSKGPAAAPSPTAKRRSSIVTFDGASLSGHGSALYTGGPHPPAAGMARAQSFSRSRSQRDSATNVAGLTNSVLAAAMFTAAATGGAGGALVPGSSRSFTGPGMGMLPLGSPEGTSSGVVGGPAALGRTTSMRRGSVTEVGAVGGACAVPHPPVLTSSTSMRRRSTEMGPAQQQSPQQAQPQLQHMTSGSAARRSSLVTCPSGGAPQSCSQVGYGPGGAEGELARLTSGGFEGMLGVARTGGSFSHGGAAPSAQHPAVVAAAQAGGGPGGLRASSDRVNDGGRFMQMLRGMFSGGGGSNSHDGTEPMATSAPQPHIATAGSAQPLPSSGLSRQRADPVSFNATARSGASYVGRSAQSVTSVPSVAAGLPPRAPSGSQHSFTLSAAAAAGMAAVGGSSVSFSGQHQYLGGGGVGGGGVAGSGPSLSVGGRGHALVPTVSTNSRRVSGTLSFRAPSNSQIPHVLQAALENNGGGGGGGGSGGSLPVLARTRSVNAAAAAAALQALAH